MTSFNDVIGSPGLATATADGSSAAHAPSAMEELPVELVALVLRYVATADCELHVKLVCKQWHELAQAELRRRAMGRIELAKRWMQANPELVIAGSAALWIRLGGPTRWRPNDVDLFWCEPSRPDGEVVLKAPPGCDGAAGRIRFLPHRPRVMSLHTVTGTLQFVYHPELSTVAKVLDSFDLSCSMVALTLAPDGQQFVVTTGADWVEWPRVTAYVMPKMDMIVPGSRARTLARIAKYERRGAGPVLNLNALVRLDKMVDFVLNYNSRPRRALLDVSRRQNDNIDLY